MLLLLAFTGCNRKTSHSNEVDVETYIINDSILLENDFGENYSYYSMNIDLPVTDNDSLRQNILHWMLNPETEDYEAFFENEKNRFFAEEGNEPGSEFVGNYALLEQTDLYVTYLSEGYVFTGGVHPMPWNYGITFSKIDGSPMGYDLFEDPEQLIDIITENIQRQYFEPNNTEEEEYLFESDETFQLPTNEPWIESDSIVFCYGPFEIAPYSAGMPMCKISINDLKLYFSKKGKNLFK